MFKKMKLNVVVGLALFLGVAASPGFAQRGVTGGVKGGLNLANLSLDPEEEGCCDMKAGGAVGGFVNIGINEIASIQPEVLFTMKGAKDDAGDKIKVNFVEIPILLRANLTRGEGVRPFVTVGPAVSFRTSAKVEDEDIDEDIKDEIETTDFGVIFGGGVAVGPATFEVRYDLGLRDLFKDDMDHFMKTLKDSKPAPGNERVVYAGLPEHEDNIERLENGIPYHPEVIDWFRDITSELELEWRLT